MIEESDAAMSKGRSHLDDDESRTTIVSTLKVDRTLVMRDVEALDCGSFFEIGRCCI